MRQRASSADRVLVHFTPKAETMRSILEKGLLLVPSPRELIREFIDDPIFADNEPQEFGMASFLELGGTEPLPAHRSLFGPVGIALYLERAIELGAQRVIYVPPDGPVFDTLRWLFRLGHQELVRSRGGAAGFPMAAISKAMAMVSRAQLWVHLLTLYEYLQPADYAGEVEWRIVNKIPFHHNSKRKEEQVEALLAMPAGWRVGCSIRLHPSDIAALITTPSTEDAIRKSLPDGFGDVPIVVADYEASAREVLHGIPPRAALDAQPEPVSSGPQDWSFPSVKKFEKGTAISHDEVVRDSRFTLSWVDENGDRNTVPVPLTEARELLMYLADAVRDPRFFDPNALKNR